MVIVEKEKTTKVSEDAEVKKEILYAAGGDVN
jgi:hypothetical protein